MTHSPNSYQNQQPVLPFSNLSISELWMRNPIFNPSILINMAESSRFQILHGSPFLCFWWCDIISYDYPLVNYRNYGKITIFNGKTHYKWPFSIAFCMFTRGYIKSHVWTVNVYALRTAESPGLLREIPGPNIFPVIGDLTDWWSIHTPKQFMQLMQFQKSGKLKFLCIFQSIPIHFICFNMV
jgi:plasmid maintenance system killer protein